MTSASNPLAQLIDSAREANQWSDPDIARRAIAAGHQVTKSHISGIRINGIAQLTPNLIRGLAAGLGVPIAEVLRAALETLGLPAGDRSVSPEQAIQSDSSLSASTKQALLAVLRSARQTKKETNAPQEQEPEQSPRGTPRRREVRAGASKTQADARSGVGDERYTANEGTLDPGVVAAVDQIRADVAARARLPRQET